MHPLISVDDLAARLDDPDLRIVDTRWYLTNHHLGARRYAESHIPGAVFLDLESDLSDTAAPDAGRHPLPDRWTLAGVLGERGIADDHTVVAYDDSGGAIASRLWWLLRWLGHGAVAVLDGGFPAWVAGGKPVTSDLPSHAPAEFRVRAPLTRVVDADAVAGRRPSAVLFDGRAPERFRGEHEPVDPVPGHIPGAVNLPTSELLGSDGRFLPVDELRGRLSGATEDSIASCGSGVTACAIILSAVASGLPEPALYPGSYSEWSRAGLPVERSAGP